MTPSERFGLMIRAMIGMDEKELSMFKVGNKVLWDYGDNDGAEIVEVETSSVLIRFANGFGLWVWKSELTLIGDGLFVVKQEAA